MMEQLKELLKNAGVENADELEFQNCVILDSK